jgi:integrase
LQIAVGLGDCGTGAGDQCVSDPCGVWRPKREGHQQRGNHDTFVFPIGKPDQEGKETTAHRMNDSAWKKARVTAATKWGENFLRKAHDGFLRVRIHNLKHTFGRRLRAAGVTEDDRKALLGHSNQSLLGSGTGSTECSCK